uniref:Uncharacterized protein n=1 Tax=Dechloromonas aromatica (strain RCB) TaxID=159087 RepID=Q47AJ0_DECAR
MASALRSQSGIALLLFLFLILGVGATLLLSATNAPKQRLNQDAKTQVALRQAKEAIIAWSVTHRTTPGRLPCPEDTTAIGGANEGSALISCSNATLQIGRIPWRTLGLDSPVDASGEILWYALSPGFRGTPPLGSVGVSTGQLQLDGITNSAAAIIIAPGAPLVGQNRTIPSAGSPPSRVNYLDMDNASGTAFTSTGPNTTFNDQVISITSQEIFQAMTFRVLAEIRGAFGLQNGLRRYYNDNGSFPPTGTSLSSLLFDAQTLGWLAPATNPNLWFANVSYTNLSPTSSRLSLGTKTMNVTPCTATACP